MGSFNVSCTASNLSINRGDKIILLPLTIDSDISKKDLLVSKFIYNYGLYQPYCLPIKGVYNDYGGVEFIEKDINTELLEKRFGYSIEEIINSICNSKDLPLKENFEKLPLLSCMFILEDIYNSFISKDIIENKLYEADDLKYIQELSIIPSILEIFGFEYISTENKTSIYSKLDNLVFLSDFSISINESGKSIYSIKNFINSWNKISGDNLNINMLYNFNYILNKAEDLFKVNKNRIFQNKDINDYYCQELRMRLYKVYVGFDSIINFEEDFYFEEYFNTQNMKIIDLFKNFKRFHKMMIAGNILYRPSSNGIQEGADNISAFILKESIKVLKNKRKD